MASGTHPSVHDPAGDLYVELGSADKRHANHRKLVAETARYLGAVSIFLVGAVHAQYYDAYFSIVPTVGPLFLLSFIGAGIVGTVLISPVRRLVGRRECPWSLQA